MMFCSLGFWLWRYEFSSRAGFISRWQLSVDSPTVNGTNGPPPAVVLTPSQKPRLLDSGLTQATLMFLIAAPIKAFPTGADQTDAKLGQYCRGGLETTAGWPKKSLPGKPGKTESLPC
jgi:hypothetical protein